MSDQPRRRRRDADANLNALLDAAAKVLGEDPGATLTEVATAAGVDRVTAWRHLGSRDHLLELLNERAVAEVREALDGVLGDRAATPDDTGRALETLARFVSRYRILFMTEEERTMRLARREALAPLIAAIRHGQDQGALRADVSPEVAAALVAAAARVAAEEAAGTRKSLKRAVAEARAVIEAGLTPT